MKWASLLTITSGSLVFTTLHLPKLCCRNTKPTDTTSFQISQELKTIGRNLINFHKWQNHCWVLSAECPWLIQLLFNVGSNFITITRSRAVTNQNQVTWQIPFWNVNLHIILDSFGPPKRWVDIKPKVQCTTAMCRMFNKIWLDLESHKFLGMRCQTSNVRFKCQMPKVELVLSYQPNSPSAINSNWLIYRTMAGESVTAAIVSLGSTPGAPGTPVMYSSSSVSSDPASHQSQVCPLQTNKDITS